MTQQSPVLTVDSVSVNYGEFQAVKSVSFNVLAGEIFGLLGPNGAGKTSTLSAIEGLVKPRTGTIVVNGYTLAENSLYCKASMGVQLQSTTFQSELTIIQILELYAGIYGLDTEPARLRSILTEIKLENAAEKKFSELSGGQQQRLSLVISTIHNPPLVLLDEPTTGLDPQARRQLWERIEALREKGHGILITTHSMEEAEAICDRVAIIDHGTVIATDTPDALIEKHRTDPDVIAVSRRGKITLEDVFIALTGKALRA